MDKEFLKVLKQISNRLWWIMFWLFVIAICHK
jgi:hypothetical protein